MAHWITAALSLIGLFISLYFMLVFHKLTPPDATYIPKFCRLDQGACETILNTPQACLLGVPNFYPGILFYLLVIAFRCLPIAEELMITVAGFAVLVSLYLAYSLIFKLKVSCVLCFASHLINLLILVVLMASV